MKSIRFILWVLVTLALLIGTDQLLIRRHFTTPVLKETQVFYRDFRARLLTLGRSGDSDDDIGRTIEAEMNIPAGETSGRYLYVDAAGALHFADSLDEVPPAYRQKAQRLAD